MNPLPALFLEAFGGDLPPECNLRNSIDDDQDDCAAELSTVRSVGQWQPLVERIRPEHPSRGHRREWDQRVFDILAEALVLHWWANCRKGTPEWGTSKGPDLRIPGERWIEVKKLRRSREEEEWLEASLAQSGIAAQAGRIVGVNKPMLQKFESKIRDAVVQWTKVVSREPLTVVVLISFDMKARVHPQTRWRPLHACAAQLAQELGVEIVVADSAMGSACAFGA